jgi:hypothetical protein
MATTLSAVHAAIAITSSTVCTAIAPTAAATVSAVLTERLDRCNRDGYDEAHDKSFLHALDSIHSGRTKKANAAGRLLRLFFHFGDFRTQDCSQSPNPGSIRVVLMQATATTALTCGLNDEIDLDIFAKKQTDRPG